MNPLTMGSRGRRVSLASTLLICSSAALATENGGSSYPMGVESNYPGVMLPEGLHGLLYYVHYHASDFKDDKGDDSKRFTHFSMRCDVLAGRLSYVWPGVKLLGANIETRLVQPVANMDVSAAVARSAPLPPLDRGGERAGFLDTALVPIILGWRSPTYHQVLGIDTHLPTGTYDKSERVNTGRNYYQVAPFYAFTWFPTPKVDVSAKFRYGFNGTNDATNYSSGDEATVEFSAGYRVTPQLALGLNGYVYRQATDDELNGVVVNGNGNRGRVNAIGPHVAYNASNRWSLIAKVQSEFGARNRPEGVRFWLQAKLPF